MNSYHILSLERLCCTKTIESEQFILTTCLIAYSSLKHWHITPWASLQIRNIADCASARNAWNVLPTSDLKGNPLVSDPGMHHGTFVTHVPWCMSGSLTRSGGKRFFDIPGTCATRNFMYLARGTSHWSRMRFLCAWADCKVPHRTVTNNYNMFT